MDWLFLCGCVWWLVLQDWPMSEGVWSWGYEREVILGEIAELEAQVAGLREYLVYVEGMIGE